MAKKYYSNKYFKIFTLNALAKILNETQGTENKLMIHTANGIYIGTLKEHTDYENLDVQDGDDALTIYRKMYLKNQDTYENSNPVNEVEKISENPISITLENVEIITSGKSITLPFVDIFVDQIIGFSLGLISQ